MAAVAGNFSRRSFNTRASKKDYVVGHSQKAAQNRSGVEGVGYGTAQAGLTSKDLPELDDNAAWDEKAKAEYRKFKESRAQFAGSTDGQLKGGTMINRYAKLEGEFAKYMEDPYSDAPVSRAPLTEDCEIVITGCGFGGLLLASRLRQRGFADIVMVEKAGDVGGTWYWNRYPGIACDVESYSYFPLLEEMDYVPSMKFASGFEIYEHCQRIAEKFNLYNGCLFHTTVESSTWDEGLSRWIVRSDRGDAMKAKFVIMANGILTTPKLALIEGMQSYKGISFHTSRWNYDVDLRGKTIGIIGTGATSVQAVPELAKVAGKLFVFQRTPSSIDVRDQKATDYSKVEQWRAADPTWARSRRARQAKLTSGRAALKADDDYLEGKTQGIPKGTKGVQKPRDPNAKPLTQDQINDKLLAANFKVMEAIRARVDEVVKDPATAASLKPYYAYGCKRPCFHDEYLPTFNLPHVKLVDVAPKGVERINEAGVVHNGTEYPLDVLIYATGFQWMDTATFQTVTGVGGETLSQKWQRKGTSTLFGMQTAGFPNLFFISGPQAGATGGFNFTVGAEFHGEYATWMIELMRNHKLDVVDADEAAEDAWVKHCAEADSGSAVLRDCITYYNGEVTAKPGSLAYYGTLWARQTTALESALKTGNWENVLAQVGTTKDLKQPVKFKSTGYTWDAEKPPGSKL